MLGRIERALAKTRSRIKEGMGAVFLRSSRERSASLEELEASLIGADLGISTTQFLMKGLRENLKRGDWGKPEVVQQKLKELLAEKLGPGPLPLAVPTVPPAVYLIIGVNGVGKTTTLGKLAHRFRERGRSVLLVAGDTFRAAAIEQLEAWGRRVDCPVIKSRPDSDPAAIVFDGITAAKARGIDAVFIDTAGRLHTQHNLMEELKKIKRVSEKALPGSPHETLLVMDATTGQNGLAQARSFHEALGLTGVILAKLDGTARGGIVVAIGEEIGIPVRLVGIGEEPGDLVDFDPGAFIRGLVDGEAQPS